jgi:hypothetical protein
MESFFAALVSASLIFTWASGSKLAVAARDTCTTGAEFQTTAVLNAATFKTASIAPFGRTEAGWQIYAPQIAHTIGTPCAPDTKGFAATLASWQAEHRLPSTGAVNTATLSVMKNAWQGARPFIEEFRVGTCPEAPAESSLADISAGEGWFGKISKLDPRALESLRKMAAAARAEDLRIAADRQFLQIISAFRSPAYDAGRCASEHNCNGVVRARCSAHRTGRAVDLYIGALPGQSPVSSDDANRLYQTQTPAYRWLVKNAARFGFVNYVFEPWHWEWVGSPASETQMLTAIAVKQAPRARPVSSASMTDTPPFARLSLRLRGLFGSAN